MKQENNSPLEKVKDEYEMLLQRQRIQHNKWLKSSKKKIRKRRNKNYENKAR